MTKRFFTGRPAADAAGPDVDAGAHRAARGAAADAVLGRTVTTAGKAMDVPDPVVSAAMGIYDVAIEVLALAAPRMAARVHKTTRRIVTRISRSLGYKMAAAHWQRRKLLGKKDQPPRKFTIKNAALVAGRLSGRVARRVTKSTPVRTPRHIIGKLRQHPRRTARRPGPRPNPRRQMPRRQHKTGLRRAPVL